MTKMTQICKAYRMLLLVAVLLLHTFHNTASAQRTVSRQSSISLSSCYTGTCVGAEAFYQQYTLNGFWEAGIQAYPSLCVLSTGDPLECLYLYAAGGYMWRLAATRGRGFNWYAGAGVLTGIEWLDPAGKLPSYLDLGVNDIRFLYGVYAKSYVELFLSQRIALLFHGALPVNFSAVTGNIHWQAGVGLKLMIN